VCEDADVKWKALDYDFGDVGIMYVKPGSGTGLWGGHEPDCLRELAQSRFESRFTPHVIYITSISA
jgi:hypothetical protein